MGCISSTCQNKPKKAKTVPKCKKKRVRFLIDGEIIWPCPCNTCETDLDEKPSKNRYI